MVGLYLFIEGGGDGGRQHTEFRNGFRTFLEKAGLAGRMPRIVASGAREHAYEDFCDALKEGKRALLLVDSEDPVSEKSPWAHLKQRPGDLWETPPGAEDDDCHLMVQCMESWFLADRDALAAFFGSDFRAQKLPPAKKPIEQVSKADVLKKLPEATKHRKTKGSYAKGKHSFDLLAQIDPAKVTKASTWADRFVRTLKTKMGA